MSHKNKTLWMGNIETWMTKYYISSLLNKINIFPCKISLKASLNKRGCASLEFFSHEEAEKILNNHNGTIIKNFEFRFNWVKSLEDKNAIPQLKKFTVKHILLINILIFSYL